MNSPSFIIIKFIMFIGVLIFQLITLYLMSYIMFCTFFVPQRLKLNSISGSMKVYLISNIICITLSLPFNSYMVVFWRYGKNIKNFNYDF